MEILSVTSSFCFASYKLYWVSKKILHQCLKLISIRFKEEFFTCHKSLLWEVYWLTDHKIWMVPGVHQGLTLGTLHYFLFFVLCSSRLKGTVQMKLTFGPTPPDGTDTCWRPACWCVVGHTALWRHVWANRTGRSPHSCRGNNNNAIIVVTCRFKSSGLPQSLWAKV